MSREVHVRLCVQRRLACSAGERPAGARVRSPVVWIAGWRETKTLKPIDDVSRWQHTICPTPLSDWRGELCGGALRLGSYRLLVTELTGSVWHVHVPSGRFRLVSMIPASSRTCRTVILPTRLTISSLSKAPSLKMFHTGFQ